MLAVRVVTSPHSVLEAGFSRVKPGTSLLQAEAAAGNLARLNRLLVFVGGLIVSQGSIGTVVLNLRTPGQYAVHVQGNKGDPGRILLFSVSPGGMQSAAPPRANVIVRLKGTRLVGLPTTLRVGRATFKVVNRSSWLRNMHIWRLDSGKTVRDFIAAFNDQHDPAWLHLAGGMDLLSPGQTARMTLRLAPGTYVADCPLSDPNKGGRAFALEGMIATFTVS
jgi:hypothetical protein